MMWMRLAISLFAILLACQAAAASEEEILPWRETSPMWVADSREWGEVRVKVKTSRDGRIAGIIWQIGDGAYVVPYTAYRDLPPPNLSSLELRWEPGYGPKPWLYLTFRLPDRAMVYIAFQDGRIVKRFIKRSGRLEEKPL